MDAPYSWCAACGEAIEPGYEPLCDSCAVSDPAPMTLTAEEIKVLRLAFRAGAFKEAAEKARVLVEAHECTSIPDAILALAKET